MSKKVGRVALVGRPNAGKSTLLNKILGAKLAITSAKPQTTRTRIVGVHTTEDMQAIFIDTPGIHEGWTELNKQMVHAALAAHSEADVSCWILDLAELAKRVRSGKPPIDPAHYSLLQVLKKAKAPLVVALNKVDATEGPMALPVIDALQQEIEFVAAVPISARSGLGVESLLEVLAKHLPEGAQEYPEDHWTEASERFLAAELIREKVFENTQQEIPYASTVEIRQFDESRRKEKRPLVKIFADIIVERGSQKGIVIGKGGSMLKKIGSAARKELAELLQCRVHLELYVKVEKEWTKSAAGLRKVGFTT